MPTGVESGSLGSVAVSAAIESRSQSYREPGSNVVHWNEAQARLLFLSSFRELFLHSQTQLRATRLHDSVIVQL